MLFYMPTKVYSESGCVEKHAEELASFGKRAMIVTGRNSARKCGALADVTAALEAFGCGYVIFDRVEENPSIETVMEARNIAKDLMRITEALQHYREIIKAQVDVLEELEKQHIN